MTRDCDAATREEALVKIWLRCFTLLPGTSKQSWGQQCSGATLMCFDLDCCHVGRQKIFSYEKKNMTKNTDHSQTGIWIAGNESAFANTLVGFKQTFDECHSKKK